MPAHVTHLLFAEDVLKLALPDDADKLFSSFGSVLALGAQGPDIFYHNRRTMPSGLSYGKRLHRHGYGRSVAAMSAHALKLHGRNALFSHAGAFTLSFTTHAVLDRITHPFIIYYSGWHDRTKPETARLAPCHAFFERIIDVLMLKDLRRTDIREYDFFSRVECTPAAAGESMEILRAGLASVIDEAPDLMEERISNAHSDATGFYFFTDPTNVHAREAAKTGDAGDPRSAYRRALFHPFSLPTGIDFLNVSGKEWTHPSFGDVKSRASFRELYGLAVDTAVPVVRAVASALNAGYPAEALEAVVGNENLNDGRSVGRPAPSLFCDPLPLAELLDPWYGA